MRFSKIKYKLLTFYTIRVHVGIANSKVNSWLDDIDMHCKRFCNFVFIVTLILRNALLLRNGHKVEQDEGWRTYIWVQNKLKES